MKKLWNTYKRTISHNCNPTSVETVDTVLNCVTSVTAFTMLVPAAISRATDPATQNKLRTYEKTIFFNSVDTFVSTNS